MRLELTDREIEYIKSHGYDFPFDNPTEEDWEGIMIWADDRSIDEGLLGVDDPGSTPLPLLSLVETIVDVCSAHIR